AGLLVHGGLRSTAPSCNHGLATGHRLADDDTESLPQTRQNEHVAILHSFSDLLAIECAEKAAILRDPQRLHLLFETFATRTVAANHQLERIQSFVDQQVDGVDEMWQ